MIRYVARGETYRHRETLRSWAWHWDVRRRLWIDENGSDPDELCVLAIEGLDGVTIECEELDGRDQVIRRGTLAEFRQERRGTGTPDATASSNPQSPTPNP